MIRTLIVDDESLAREFLIEQIGKDSHFQVVGFASNGVDAIKKMKELKPDVIFLDIEMPEKNGLEVAEELAQWKSAPLVVFQTAFHQYAIEAFESNAVDYIVKPVDQNRLMKTLERVKRRIQSQASQQENLMKLQDDLRKKGLVKKIAVSKRGSKDRVLLEPSDIFYFDVHLAQVRANTLEGEWLVSMTLKELLDSLDTSVFVQTHKSFVVNLQHISKVSPMFSGNFEITLKHPSFPKIPLSRRFSASLKSRLGSW